MAILLTGAAGFVGFHTARRLLADGHTVVGLDSLNHYYDVRLKEARLERLREHPGFSFVRMQLQDRPGIAALFGEGKFERVVHLAAQAGVAYSLDHPDAYVEANVVGFLNILEGCRRAGTPHLVYASSSSVYGGNTRMPFAETNAADHPLTLYGATKRANELMAHAYSHLFGLPTSGLRFFTVYGPWGRPDMVFFLFTRAILAGRPLDVYNFGAMQRDFTYVDDVVSDRARAGGGAGARSGGVRGSRGGAGSGRERRPVSRVQRGQSGAGAPDGRDRAVGGVSRQAGAPEFPADAGRGRAGNVRERGAAADRHGVRAGDTAQGRHPPLRGLVPRVLRPGRSSGRARAGRWGVTPRDRL